MKEKFTDLWKFNSVLKELEHEIDEYDLFSFDIFDTLLFRKCDRPSDIFGIAYKKAQIKFGKNRLNISEREYIEIRRTAERTACEKNKPHQNYEMIFEEMKFDKDILLYLKGEETETELENIFLNQDVASVIYYLRDKNKKIVLVSEMYYSSDIITLLLKHAGFDINVLDGIYISSEYECHKGDGRLFEKMCDTFPDVEKKRILHIGDNFDADVKGAQRVGISTLLYNVSKPLESN